MVSRPSVGDDIIKLLVQAFSFVSHCRLAAWVKYICKDLWKICLALSVFLLYSVLSFGKYTKKVALLLSNKNAQQSFCYFHMVEWRSVGRCFSERKHCTCVSMTKTSWQAVRLTLLRFIYCLFSVWNLCFTLNIQRISFPSHFVRMISLTMIWTRYHDSSQQTAKRKWVHDTNRQTGFPLSVTIAFVGRIVQLRYTQTANTSFSSVMRTSPDWSTTHWNNDTTHPPTARWTKLQLRFFEELRSFRPWSTKKNRAKSCTLATLLNKQRFGLMDLYQVNSLRGHWPLGWVNDTQNRIFWWNITLKTLCSFR